MPTIDEAKRTLEDILKYVKPGDPPEEHDAIKLGIEALEQVKLQRQFITHPSPPRLPSETID